MHSLPEIIPLIVGGKDHTGGSLESQIKTFGLHLIGSSPSIPLLSSGPTQSQTRSPLILPNPIILFQGAASSELLTGLESRCRTSR